MCNKNILTIIFVILTLAIGSLFFYSLNEKYNISGLFWINKGNWKWKDSWAKNNNFDLKKIEINQNILKPEVVAPQIVEGLVLTYDEAMQKSKELDRPVLLVFGAEWCKYCTKMKSETFSQDSVKEVLKKYIVSHVDVDKNPKIGAKYSVKSLPYYVITNSSEQDLKRGKGFMAADEFIKWLNK